VLFVELEPKWDGADVEEIVEKGALSFGGVDISGIFGIFAEGS
jgi:hypothetical protein